MTKIPLHFKRDLNLLVLTSPGFNGLLTVQLVSEEGEDVFHWSGFDKKPTKNFLCHSYRSNFLSQANNLYATSRSSIEESILGKLLPALEELLEANPNTTKKENCFQVKIQLFTTRILSIFPSKPAVDLEGLSAVRRELNRILDVSESLLQEVKDIRKLILKEESSGDR